MELICFSLHCFSVPPMMSTMNMYWFYNGKQTLLKRKRKSVSSLFIVVIASLSLTCSKLDVLLPLSHPPTSPHHSSEPALIRSTMMSLCVNSGPCSDPIWLHNSAVFLNAINHFQFLATLPWPSTLLHSPSCPSALWESLPSLLCELFHSAIRSRALQGQGLVFTVFFLYRQWSKIISFNFYL